MLQSMVSSNINFSKSHRSINWALKISRWRVSAWHRTWTDFLWWGHLYGCIWTWSANVHTTKIKTWNLKTPKIHLHKINASFQYPSLKIGRPSNISTIFPAEREALRRLASRKRREGSSGNDFLWIPKCWTLGVSWRIICTKETIFK